MHQLGAAHGYHHYFHTFSRNRINAQFGLAIFSKYPIVDQGLIRHPAFDKSSANNGIFVDLLVKGDTLRIVNVHLQSMSILEEELTNPESCKTRTGMWPPPAHGFARRASQVEGLLASQSTCPHPVIVCGDFNDLPYSYTYLRMRSWLHSSFEDAGSGLGFTYNGKLFFLRIDNIFYHPARLQALEYRVLRALSYSDHFPIRARFAWRPAPQSRRR
ncbi:MAG: endonuclease/exonuclease/phosphatase family protein [Cytophagales bacterium]|nr:endonuclease/exonuclease/phosphatase family protein [Cytophagales bacterium]